MSAILWTLALAAQAPALASGPDADREGFEFFEKKIRPLLSGRCLKCHGEGKKSPKGNLRLDSREGLLKGGDSGPAIVPRDPEKSLLLRLLRSSDPEVRMPPPSEKAPLSAEEISHVERWIRRGAPDPRVTEKRSPPGEDLSWASRKEWVFRPPADPPVPDVKGKAWTGNPVDAFLLAKLEKRGLTFAPAADKRTLLRRVTIDLVGLPPTPGEIEAFLADGSPDAFGKVVDRLLASPRYGERWARHWLDLARYATVREDGNVKSSAPSEIPEAWRYRDWVIDAFNRDLPYDQFVLLQVAGDLLPAADPGGVNVEGLVASGFLAIGEWGIQDDNPEKMVWDTADEQIDAVGRTFMGLTLGCARCHDHKFDPLTTRDYYALAGIFTSTHVVAQPAKINVQTPMVRVPLVGKPQEQSHRTRTQELKTRIAGLEKSLAEKREEAYRDMDGIPGKEEEDARLLPGEAQLALARLRDEIRSLTKELPAPLPVALAAQEGGIPGSSYAGFRNARIRIRGDYERPGAEVPRGFPAALRQESSLPSFSGSGRLELARWLASPSHPLTARVLVNRLFQHHFGRGLVRTPSNFGRLGEAPTHPELLDWLAHRFTHSNWSMKAMHRLLLTSRAYQQSSSAPPEIVEKDPENRLLGRMNRRRIEAEVFRDSLLAVAGRLDLSAGGPADPEPSSRRRMIYLRVSRTSRSPFEALFDGADSTAHTDVRTVSTVAPQALFLMNHGFVSDQATALAKRLSAGEASPPIGRIRRAYALLYSREPDPGEVDLGLEFLRRSRDEALGWRDYVRVLLGTNEFVIVD